MKTNPPKDSPTINPGAQGLRPLNDSLKVEDKPRADEVTGLFERLYPFDGVYEDSEIHEEARNKMHLRIARVEPEEKRVTVDFRSKENGKRISKSFTVHGGTIQEVYDYFQEMIDPRDRG